MIRLRGHHLLCVLTFEGAGYNKQFTRNLAAIVDRLNDGEEILIVDGPDDVCAPVMADADSHCRLARVERRDALALEAISPLIGSPPSVGTMLRLDRDTVRELRASFSTGQIRAACEGCEWHALCGRIARRGFDHTRLLPVARRPKSS